MIEKFGGRRCGALKPLFQWSLALLAILASDPIGAQDEVRLVIATNVACRAEPVRTAPAVRQFRIGEPFLAGDRTEADGEVWYFDRWRSCWIFGPLTTQWQDRELALLRAADRILSRTDDVPFEDFVAVDNLLVQTQARAHAASMVIAGSPLLQLRRIQILERAAAARGVRREAVARDPLKSAWFFSNRAVLRPYEPAGRWIVLAETYWELYERNQESEWAEEMAWAAARAFLLADECDAPCVLEEMLETLARYWSTFPEGRWIEEALHRGAQWAERATHLGCVHPRGEGIEHRTQRVRDTLDEVVSPSRGGVLSQLDDIERVCQAGPR